MTRPPCTWTHDGKRCDRVALRPQYDQQGRPWADLCIEHEHDLKQALAGTDAKRLLGCWVKAQGGARVAAGRV